jgi:NAD(P)H dehydrogenase (quinone)
MIRFGVSLGNSKLGRFAIQYLIETSVPTENIVAIVRNREKAGDLAAQGVTVRIGTYGDSRSFETALEGVDELYLVSGMAPPRERILLHRGVIDAAKAAGVKHIVYTSFIDNADNSPFFAWNINRDTEAYLKDSGLDFTVLRHGMYVEADLDYIDQYVKDGKVENNIGEGLISYISRRDLALAGAHCLLDETHRNRTYVLTGPEAYSQKQLAHWISSWKAMEIPYIAISDEEYRGKFSNPDWADVVVTLYQAVRMGLASTVSNDFEAIVGRKAYKPSEVYEKFYL